VYAFGPFVNSSWALFGSMHGPGTNYQRQGGCSPLKPLKPLKAEELSEVY